MNKKIKNHFQKNDPILHAIIEQVMIEEWEQNRDYFRALCSDIVGQQLSGKAADTIWGRFIKLIPQEKVTPENILTLPDQKIRNAGLSWAKVKYVKDLADKVKNKEVNLKKLSNLSNEDVIAELTKVKGIGPWTAEMFLMFTLGREDVFSHGDLGLKNAIKKLYGFKKDPTKKQVEKIVTRWTPYKTYACRILWKSLEIKPI